MNLSAEQIQAVDRGSPVPIVVEGRRCVVILEDVYDRVKSVFEVDPENAYPATLEAWDSVGSPDDASYEQ